MTKRTPPTDRQQRAAANLRRLWARRPNPMALTQEQMAAACGWTQGNFGHYLHGRIALNTEAVLRIASALGVAPTDIDPDLGALIPAAAPPPPQGITVTLPPDVSAALMTLASVLDRDPAVVARALLRSAAQRQPTARKDDDGPRRSDQPGTLAARFVALDLQQVAALQALVDSFDALDLSGPTGAPRPHGKTPR